MDDVQERPDGEQPSGAAPTPPRRPRLTPEELEAAKAKAQAARAERAARQQAAPAAAAAAPVPAEAGTAATAPVATAAAPARVPVARAISADEPGRRSFIKIGFWGTMGAFAALALYQFMDFFWPRGVVGFGGRVSAGKVTDYPPGGEPKRNNEGRFYMVHVTPEKGGEGQYRGLLALWQRCPHLGCTVPWRGDSNFEGTQGWFLCPCHGSRYSYAGVRVFGPAPRSMDTMKITVDASGNIVVDTAEITEGGTTPGDNPSRALQV
jgi:cytochrome b6-f complex iron-sulfur subunit